MLCIVTDRAVTGWISRCWSTHIQVNNTGRTWEVLEFILSTYSYLVTAITLSSGNRNICGSTCNRLTIWQYRYIAHRELIQLSTGYCIPRHIDNRSSQY